MQNGMISSIGQMRLLRNGIGVLSFGVDLDPKNHQLGYSFYLFAENIIKKYEILDGVGFDVAVLLFLQNLHEEAEQHEKLKTYVEQTLRLLVLWNGRNEAENQIVCNQNLYLSNLRNEIELNLSYIKELSSRQYNQLSELYSSERLQQNLLLCKTLIAQLNTSVSTSTETTEIFQDNQVKRITNTAVGGKTIKPYSLSNSFRTMLERIVNISHTASNRELFYSSVKNQLITNFFAKKPGDIQNLKNLVLHLMGGSPIQNQYSPDAPRSAELTYDISQASHEQTVLSNVNVDEINRYYGSLAADARVFNTLEERRQLLTRLLSVSVQNTFAGATSYVQNHIADSNEFHPLSEGERQIINILSSVSYPELSAISNNIPNNVFSSGNTFSTVNNISPMNPSETEIINNISRSTDALQSVLMARERGLEYLQNTDGVEFDLISQKIVELSNIREYAILQKLTERLFSQKHSHEISQLITSGERLSREVMPLLREKSFTKSELFKTIENGRREEKVLAVSALSFATENVANNHLNDSRFENIMVLKNLLQNAESHNFDFSKVYELDGAELTLNQFVSRQEQTVWNELEKQVNQYKTIVSQQVENISILGAILNRSMTKNEVITVLNNTKNESIIQAISAAISNISTHSEGDDSKFGGFFDVPKINNLNQNSLSSLWRTENHAQSIRNPQSISSPALQHRTTQISETSESSSFAVSSPSYNNAKVLSLISQLSNYLSSNLSSNSQYQSFSVDKAHRLVGGDPNPFFGPTLTESLLRKQKLLSTKAVEEMSGVDLKRPSPVLRQEPSETKAKGYPLARALAPVFRQEPSEPVTEQYRATAELLYAGTEKGAPQRGGQAAPAREVNGAGQSKVTLIKNITLLKNITLQKNITLLKNITLQKNITDRAATQRKNQAAEKLRGSMGKIEPISLNSLWQISAVDEAHRLVGGDANLYLGPTLTGSFLREQKLHSAKVAEEISGVDLKRPSPVFGQEPSERKAKGYPLTRTLDPVFRQEPSEPVTEQYRATAELLYTGTEKGAPQRGGQTAPAREVNGAGQSKVTIIKNITLLKNITDLAVTQRKNQAVEKLCGSMGKIEPASLNSLWQISAVDEAHRPVGGDANLYLGPTLTGSLLREQKLLSAKAAEEIPGVDLKTSSSAFGQESSETKVKGYPLARTSSIRQELSETVTERYRATAELLYSGIEKDALPRGGQAASAREVNGAVPSSVALLKNITDMAVTQRNNQTVGKLHGFMGKIDQRSLVSYFTSQIAAQEDLVARSNKISYNDPNVDNKRQGNINIDKNADMVLYNTGKTQKKESQPPPSHTPSRSELISQFGNLIYDPNLPPSELIGKQTGSILTDSTLSSSVDAVSIRELVEKLTLGEKAIKEEQSRVTELTQKLTEQENAMYRLKHAHTQLQADMAAGTNVKKITSRVMKEFRAKMRLEQMRYGLQ